MSTVTPLLDVQDVSYAAEGRQLLAPVSLTLNAGEFVLLTGSSGSGKSTLLKIMASLLSPSAGDIWFKGEPITALKAESYRQQVSYCFQTPALFGTTVYDNLAFPWQIRQKKADREGLKHWLNRVNLPAESLDKKIGQLSGGEKQRVALLRNLQFLPQVLLLDEITSALDEENKQLTHQLIAALVKEEGTAVVWISHDSAEISQAQRVVTLTAPVSGSHHEPA
ncbi:iron ABC transporter ATP-binding protein FetA [Erwiniaceae bacterium BAC15a-03b]|uniref:Iron ABC transporter ATP-binding protein FetA n=1 Tax=Winslowiella arboricola TaxID=2978220 RepID=A0A9J6PZF9_9GAMM|nr:iron ABC transporter ATP-binding protein FetA [Winslowiella arboricola]MCU5775295.1 iron ABC transporter ATP-binding protein FetA [Winslowiella arboricola]MCU5780308.1 iron ABC transporter ATP-binding protein FetA [Winslowiella arboricola]